MKKKLAYLLILSILSAMALPFGAGCTVASSDAPDLSELDDVAELGPQSAEAAKERQKELEAIARAPYPPYYLNPGDVYRLKVFDNPEMGVESTVVTPDGYLTMPLIGAVKVSGLTPDDARKKIEKQLEEYIRYPKAVLIPLSINSQLATLAGKVSSSGRFNVNGTMRLADLFALGQGTPNSMDDGHQMELADLATSLYVRDGKILPIDFVKALRGDPLHNIRVFPNDYVFISTRATQQVSVIGEVNSPKFVTWYDNTGILEVIASARGVRDEHSKHVIVIRGSMSDPKVYRIDLEDVMRGKKRNPHLRPGDVVYVPKDGISEYNVFVRKIVPTGQLVNMFITPMTFWTNF